MLNAKFYQKCLLLNTKEDGMLIVFLEKIIIFESRFFNINSKIHSPFSMFTLIFVTNLSDVRQIYVPACCIRA